MVCMVMLIVLTSLTVNQLLIKCRSSVEQVVIGMSFGYQPNCRLRILIEGTNRESIPDAINRHDPSFICLFVWAFSRKEYIFESFVSDMSTFKYNFISITRKHNWMMNGSEHDT